MKINQITSFFGNCRKNIAGTAIGAGAVVLMLSSCSDDRLPDPGNTVTAGGQRSEMTLELGLALDSPEERSRLVDFDAQFITVDSVWVGVYDDLTGTRVGQSLLYLGRGNVPNTNFTGTNAKVSIVYFDEHPQVHIVSVANFGGLADADGNKLSQSLIDADTWDKFIEVSFTAGSLDDKQNGDRPLLMGFYYNAGASGNDFQTKVDQFSSFNGDGSVKVLENGNSNDTRVVLVSGNSSSTDPKFDKMQKLDGAIQLRRVRTQVNVNLQAGDGVSISDVQYKRLNMPTYAYIAPRLNFDPENVVYSTIEDWVKLSPNKSDTKMDIDAMGKITAENDAYTSDEEWITVDGTSFWFQHLENRRWSTFQPATYAERVKRVNVDGFDETLWEVLCRGGERVAYMNCNNRPSVIQLKMHITDSKNGFSGEVEYLIPEGYCNDKNGTATSTESVKLRDFSAVRNTKYNYNITVKGVNNIVVNVTSDGATHSDDQSGSLYGVDIAEVNPEGETVEGAYTMPTPASVAYRLYERNAAGEVHDYWYGFEPASLAQFAGSWPEFAAQASDASYFSFIAVDNGTGSYPVDQIMEIPGVDGTDINVTFESYEETGGDIENAFRALYIFNPEEIENGITDADGCSSLHILTGYTQKAKDSREPLGSINPVYNYPAPINYSYWSAAANTLAQLSWQQVENADYYVVTINNTTQYTVNADQAVDEVVSCLVSTEGMSVGVNYPVRIVAYDESGEHKSSSRSWNEALRITSDSSWNFAASPWNTITSANFPGNFSLDGLYFGSTGSYSTGPFNTNYIAWGGSGNRNNRYFKFYTKKTGKFTFTVSRNSAGTQSEERYMKVDVEGATSKVSDSSYLTLGTTAAQTKTISTAFDDVEPNADGYYTVYIYPESSFNISKIEFTPDN